MAIITLAQVKEQLGISSSDYDSAITAKLPYIDAKVKSITNNNWNKRIFGSTTSGSAYIEVSDYQNTGYDYILDWLEVGQQITGTGIDTGAYVSDIWPEGTATSDNAPQIEISSNATATNSGADLFLGFPIQFHDIVANGVWYLINGTSTTLPTNPATSESMGPASVSYSSADNKIDARYGMPAWFVKGLPKYARGH